jgi:hypothetical protein
MARPLRIGFDMDGVLADFASAFRDVEVRLFGPGPALRAGEPEKEEAKQSSTGELDAVAEPKARVSSARELQRRRDVIWNAIQATPDFWVGLKPIEPGAVARIHSLMLHHGWEVSFITQRPVTKGDTVQRQTQRWLVAQGFDLPSVLVIAGSRGAAASALRLDYHVDDSAQNCLDVLADSSAKSILVAGVSDDTTVTGARRLGIGTAPAVNECLDILEQAAIARDQPGVLRRIASLVGWK